jgi:hypothetical protein
MWKSFLLSVYDPLVLYDVYTAWTLVLSWDNLGSLKNQITFLETRLYKTSCKKLWAQRVLSFSGYLSSVCVCIYIYPQLKNTDARLYWADDVRRSPLLCPASYVHPRCDCPPRASLAPSNRTPDCPRSAAGKREGRGSPALSAIVIPRRSVASYCPLAGRRPARSCTAPCANHGVLARSAAPWHSGIRREAQILEGNHRSNLVASYVRPHIHEYLYLPSTTMPMLLLPPRAMASRSAPCVHFRIDVAPVHAESTAMDTKQIDIKVWITLMVFSHLPTLIMITSPSIWFFFTVLFVFNSWSLYFIFAALYIMSHPLGSGVHEWQLADQPPGAKGRCPPSATSSRGRQAPSAASGQDPHAAMPIP